MIIKKYMRPTLKVSLFGIEDKWRYCLCETTAVQTKVRFVSSSEFFQTHLIKTSSMEFVFARLAGFFGQSTICHADNTDRK